MDTLRPKLNDSLGSGDESLVNEPTILLIGATGFVGRHAAVALAATGWKVRAATRNPEQARASNAALHWIQCDLESDESLRKACAGARAAVYLYHAIGTKGDYARLEAKVAQRFARAADEARLDRVVYLGGVVPVGRLSRHLESRRATGEALRQGKVSTIELRTSMVIGYPSASFQMIRDVVVNTPWLLLPAWLDNASCPISICDVASAIALAARLPTTASIWYELPGPERLSHRQLLGYVAEPLGTRIGRTKLTGISPSIVSLAIAALSRVPPSLSRELVLGLQLDLAPTGPSFWDRVGRPELRPLRQAIADALSDEIAPQSPSVETTRRIQNKARHWLAAGGVTSE